MRLVALPLCALISAGLASSGFGQTYEELLRENQALHAQIQALQHGGGESAHAHANGHEHGAKDYAGLDGHDHGGHGGHAHGSDHSGHGHSEHGCKECEPTFDFCCPYENHHGGHGHCDLCRGHHGASNGSHGGQGHDGHGDHQHGPAYHHSIEGYPLLHAARTEFTFVERHIHLVLADTRGADGGEVNELEYESEITYALTDRIVFTAALPLVSLDPVVEPNTTGIGDMEFGLNMMAYNGKWDGVFFGLNVTAPTGDAERDLGAGNASLSPGARWVHDFGGGTYMYHLGAFDLPVDVDEVENAFTYDAVALHTFLSTENSDYFRYFTVICEINIETIVNGPDSGLTVVDLTPGLTWVSRGEDEIAIGWSFPISGDQNFDEQFLINYIHHL